MVKEGTKMAESKYLEFKFVEAKPKTQVWNVLSKSDGSVLGTIKWYVPWRQYCFFPQTETVFSAGCIGDIINFMNDLLDLKKAK